MFVHENLNLIENDIYLLYPVVDARKTVYVARQPRTMPTYIINYMSEQDGQNDKIKYISGLR